jgi:hypothetical protein
MSTTATVTSSISRTGAVADGLGLHNGSWWPLTARRGAVKQWQRLAAAIWDYQFLCLQRAVYRAAPRFAAHLDEFAHRRDEVRRERP